MAPPPGFVPPELPPSVEEAYRAKCIQLKQRLNEVEEANDSARLRIARINRGIQKSRLERAFLLEQLAKRTSTNVEDSEGSPSPPPTPKEKPLRTKRGHRKPDYMSTDVGEGRSGNIFIRQGPATMSPCSENFSHTQHETQQTSATQDQSQVSKLPPKNETHSIPVQNNMESAQSQNNHLKSSVDMYSSEVRPRLPNESGKETSDASCESEANLARDCGTKEPSRKKDRRKYEIIKNPAEISEQEINDTRATDKLYGERRPKEEPGEEDTEIHDNFGTPITATPEISGFTPVNRG